MRSDADVFVAGRQRRRDATVGDVLTVFYLRLQLAEGRRCAQRCRRVRGGKAASTKGDGGGRPNGVLPEAAVN